ncbi:MAG: alpha-L-fucosidase [Blautia sp.]
MSLGDDFSYQFEDHYKTGRQVICLLTDVVVKGGNLAVNVGPQPDGRIPAENVKTLKRARRMACRIQGKRFTELRPCSPYKKDGIGFTKKGDAVYAIQTFADEKETVSNTVWIPYTETVKEITALGEDTVESFERTEGGYRVVLTEKCSDTAPFARVFKLER